jgi:hypothetical protein
MNIASDTQSFMEGAMPMIMEGTPPLRGVPCPTFQCGQNVKVKTNLFISALANALLTLVLKY